jgi:hypothetical protein
MIKKYLEFIKEDFEGFNSVGEYIEDLAKDDEYALNIISQYTKDIDLTIRLANAINLLDKSTQDFIIKMIQDNKNGTGEQKDPVVTAHTDANLLEANEISQSGKFLFKCFLKVLTALGQKDISPKWGMTPDDYLIYFLGTSLEVEFVKSVMGRYTQFGNAVGSIEYTNNDCQLYFGIKTDLSFSYGIVTEDRIIPIGVFKISKGVFNWMVILDSPSSHNLKKELISMDFNRLLLCGKVKEEMKRFNPGESQHKMKPIISSGVITFGYYGIGNWSNGQMNADDLSSIKNSFMSFLSKYKWSDKVQISVTANQFWLYLNIKIK